MSAQAIARIELNAADPDRLAKFYETAFGFVRQGETDWPSEPASQLFDRPISLARVVSLRLGEQRLDLVGLMPPGAPCPGDVLGWSPLFQHFAMIVSDMETAYDRLRGVPGWQPISQGGPQRLPAASGGVTAFKFRDPEGHPLELLAFPSGEAPGIWRHRPHGTASLGIDHSAISIAETERSIRFYEGLGFAVSSRSHNRGPEQARLDGLTEPDVAVTGLTLPGSAAPHLELLCYRSDRVRAHPTMRAGDGVATRLTLAMTDSRSLEAIGRAWPAQRVSPAPVRWPDGRVEMLLRDPDGHHLLLTAPA